MGRRRYMAASSRPPVKLLRSAAGLRCLPTTVWHRTGIPLPETSPASVARDGKKNAYGGTARAGTP